VSDSEKVVEGPYLRADREDQTYVALGERLWRRLGTAAAPTPSAA
jgi:hypothetical protein